EHVVTTPELAGLLDRHDVLGLLDDTDDLVGSARIPADAALLGLGDVEAGGAEPHELLDPLERCREPVAVGRVGLQQMEGEALGALRPDPGQSTELVDEVLDRSLVHRLSTDPSAQKPGRPSPPPIPPMPALSGPIFSSV